MSLYVNSPTRVVQVLRALVTECRAEGMDVLSIDSLDAAVKNMETRLKKSTS